jgi:hypothetical protein
MASFTSTSTCPVIGINSIKKENKKVIVLRWDTRKWWDSSVFALYIKVFCSETVPPHASALTQWWDGFPVIYS